jgi:hypothetical protein
MRRIERFHGMSSGAEEHGGAGTVSMALDVSKPLFMSASGGKLIDVGELLPLPLPPPPRM